MRECLSKNRSGALWEYEKRIGKWGISKCAKERLNYSCRYQTINPHNRDLRDLGFSGVDRHSRVSGPRVDEKRDQLTCRCESYPGLPRGDENHHGALGTSVFSGKSEDAVQSWVRGLLLGTRRGCLDPWRGI